MKYYYVPEKRTCTISCKELGYPFTDETNEVCGKCAGHCRTCKLNGSDLCTSCN